MNFSSRSNLFFLIITSIFLLVHALGCSSEKVCQKEEVDPSFFGRGSESFFENAMYAGLIPDKADNIQFLDSVLGTSAEDEDWESYTQNWLKRYVYKEDYVYPDKPMIDCKSYLHPKYPDSLCTQFAHLFHTLNSILAGVSVNKEGAVRSRELAYATAHTTWDTLRVLRLEAIGNLKSYLPENALAAFDKIEAYTRTVECRFPDSVITNIRSNIALNKTAIYLEYPLIDSTMKYLDRIKDKQPDYYICNRMALLVKLADNNKIRFWHSPYLSREKVLDSMRVLNAQWKPIIDSLFRNNVNRLASNDFYFNLMLLCAAAIEQDGKLALDIAEPYLPYLVQSPLAAAFVGTSYALNGEEERGSQLMETLLVKAYGSDAIMIPTDSLLKSLNPEQISSLLTIYSTISNIQGLRYVRTKSTSSLHKAQSFFSKTMKTMDVLAIASMSNDGPRGMLNSIDTGRLVELGLRVYKENPDPQIVFSLMDKAKVGSLTEMYKQRVIAPDQKEVMAGRIRKLLLEGETSLKAVQDSLPPNTSMISYIIGNEDAFGMYTNASGKAIFKALISPDSIRRWAYECKQYLGMEKDGSLATYSRQAYKLYKALIKPFHLHTEESLIIIPDGELLNFPFSALLMDSVQNLVMLEDRLHELKYVIDKHPIRYAYSAQSWLEQKTRMEYLADAPIFKQTYWGLIPEVASCNIHSALDVEGSSVQEAKKIWGGEAKVSIGLGVTKSYFMDNMNASLEQVKGYNIIQTLTHGGLDAQTSKSSYLEFSCINPNQPELQNLYAHEILNMEATIPMQLLVLSACQSGMTMSHNSEGLSDMGRCFAATASCPALYTGLWALHEYSTNEILSEAFNLIAHDEKSFSSALHQAQLQYRNTNRQIMASPRYWAGIGMFGADGRIKK